MTIKVIQQNIESMDNGMFYKRAWIFLGGSLGVTAILYSYFLGATVFNVVERKISVDKMKLLASDVAGLEQEYLALENSIGLKEAEAMGFKEASKTAHFASRKGPLQAFLVKNNEL